MRGDSARGGSGYAPPSGCLRSSEMWEGDSARGGSGYVPPSGCCAEGREP